MKIKSFLKNKIFSIGLYAIAQTILYLISNYRKKKQKEKTT